VFAGFIAVFAPGGIGTTANATPAAPEKLGLAVYVDNLAEKAGNARRSLEEGQVRLVRGVFRVK